MNFHLGKPILVMIVIALVAGGAALLQPGQEKADLTLWVFADSHRKSYQKPVAKFQQQNGMTVNVNLISGSAMDLRLNSMFMADPYSEELPDLAEIEISWVGKYFRPPLDQVGLIPLNDFLKESGWEDKIVKQRLAPWTKDGVIFGIPHDVHPVTITYRHDLFQEAGVDPEGARTWPEFHEALLRFRDYWRRKVPHRHAIEAGVADSSLVQMILLQRGINIVDQHLNVNINDPRVAETIVFYAQMVAGPRKVSGQSTGGEGALIKDIVEGNLCAFLTPDWRSGYFKRYAASMPGVMRMMPLPVFEPGNPPTTTWGGTCIGITRACKRPRDAWKLIEYLYFAEEPLEERRRETGILPPVMSIWDRPQYDEPDPFYYGQQKSQALFVELGRQVPRRYQTPVSPMAAQALAFVLNKAVAYVDEHNSTEGLRAQCQQWLDDAAKDLHRRIAHWRFDQ